jgi:hypothetical protein
MCVFIFELLARFGVRGVDDDAFHWTYDHALRLVVVTDAFGAQRRIDDVVLLAKRNRLVRADWFADVAIDAGIEDLQGHAGLVYMGRRLLCEAAKSISGERQAKTPTNVHLVECAGQAAKASSLPASPDARS